MRSFAFLVVAVWALFGHYTWRVRAAQLVCCKNAKGFVRIATIPEYNADTSLKQVSFKRCMGAAYNGKFFPSNPCGKVLKCHIFCVKPRCVCLAAKSSKLIAYFTRACEYQYTVQEYGKKMNVSNVTVQHMPGCCDHLSTANQVYTVNCNKRPNSPCCV